MGIKSDHRGRVRLRLLVAALAAVAGALGTGGALAAPVGASPAAASSASAPAIEPGCDTTRIPEGDFFLANTIVGSRACRKCDELAWGWAHNGYRTLCVQISTVEAWLFIG